MLESGLHGSKTNFYLALLLRPIAEDHFLSEKRLGRLNQTKFLNDLILREHGGTCEYFHPDLNRT